MKSKTYTDEKLQKLDRKREKEMIKLEKEKARPKGKLHLQILIFIICIIYLTDEVASQIGTLMKTEIANDLFNSESSVSLLEILSMVVVPFQVLAIFYKPLSDRYGRKKFLIINTLGMSLALLLIFLSNNIAVYAIGACAISFFIPHDMHVVYIMETAPPKYRAIMYSVIKFVANMGVMLIPLLRRLLMKTPSEWRNVYFVPALLGLVVCLIAFFFARETDAYIDSRLTYLKTPKEAIEAEKTVENSQGGIIPALKYALKNKQLRWLYIVGAFFNVGFIASVNYQVILSYGYAENFVSSGMFAQISDDVLATVSNGPVTAALFLFPIGSAIAQVIMGFVSDSKGRKTAAIVTATNCLVSFIIFSFGARLGWNPYLIGFFCGAFVGSFYSTNDIIIMMVGESAPTNLRSSIMSAEFVIVAFGFVLSYGVSVPLVGIFGNTVMGVVAFALLVPGFILGLSALKLKTSETKGVSLESNIMFD